MMKKGMKALAVLLFLVHSAHAQGPNAAAVPALDLEAGNSTNDGVTNLTGVVAGTAFDVELFASGIASTVAGVNISFNLDAAQVKLTGATAPLFPLAIPQDNSVALAAFAPATIGADGFLGAVTFMPQDGVTAETEFSITLTEFTVADAGGTQDILSLEGVTVELTFNQAPPGPELSGPADPIDSGGSSSASGDVTISNLTAGDVVTLTVTVENSSDLSATANVGGTAVGEGTSTVTITAAGATETVSVVASGANSTVTIVGSVGDTEIGTASLAFSGISPAELAAFGGEILEEMVVLNWTTLSQTNNAGWRVLRSEDGVTYTPISELIPGAGTSDAVIPYAFADAAVPTVELVYYRLEQIDLDGRITQTSPIEVILGARFLDLPGEFATSIYPNPFNPSTTIAYDLPSEATVSIVIYDALGQEVRRLIADTKAAGRYTIQWDARDNLGRGVGSGVYIAKVEAGAFSATQKMLLLK